MTPLEQQITELWGHITAATHRFLELVAEFDDQGTYGVGIASCAHWLHLYCGIGMVAAREKVRVAQAIRQLPGINAAFREGRVSYSKVRAMTRVATPENEDILLNIARYGTASHVERTARYFRRVESLEAAAQAAEAHQERFLQICPDDAGQVLIRGRVPAEVGELFRQAIERAIELGELDTERRCRRERDTGWQPRGSDDSAESSERRISDVEAAVPEDVYPVAARRADALRLLAQQFLANEAKASGNGAADRFQVVVHIDQALLSDRSEPALALAPDSPSVPDSTSVPDSPSAPDSPSGTPSGTALEASVAKADAASAKADPHGNASTSHRSHRRPMLAEFEQGLCLAAETARRLACDGTLVGIVDGERGEPLNVGRKTRTIAPALRRALRARDGGCRFPGCTHTRYTEAHHVEHWAHGGETKLANLITLCHFHHHLLHEGGFRLRCTDDGLFVFTAPDGDRLPEAIPVERRFRGSALPEINRQRNIDIQPDTVVTRWGGERMDYSIAIEALLAARERASLQTRNE